MTYDPKTEYAGHLKRIARDLFVFRGRSQRTELVLFLILAMLVSQIVSLTAGKPSWPLALAFSLPLMALLARRLHDFNRSGWFAIMVPVVAMLNAWAWWQFEAGILPSPELPFAYEAVRIVLVIGFWAIVVWPGTKGANRFGPDPRTGEVLPAT